MTVFFKFFFLDKIPTFRPRAEAGVRDSVGVSFFRRFFLTSSFLSAETIRGPHHIFYLLCTIPNETTLLGNERTVWGIHVDVRTEGYVVLDASRMRLTSPL